MGLTVFGSWLFLTVILLSIMSSQTYVDDNDQDSEHTPTPSPLINNSNAQHLSNESSSSNARDRSSRLSKKSRSSKTTKQSRRVNNDINGNGRSSRQSQLHYHNHVEKKKSSSYPHTSSSSRSHRDSHRNNTNEYNHHNNHNHIPHSPQYGTSNNIKSQRQKPPATRHKGSKAPKRTSQHHNHNHNHNQHRTKSEKDKQGQHQNHRKQFLKDIEENGHNKNHVSNLHKEKLPNRKKLVILAVGDNTQLTSHAAFDFIHCKVGMERKVSWKTFDVMVLIVPTNTPSKKKETMFEACRKAKKTNPKLFVCIIDEHLNLLFLGIIIYIYHIYHIFIFIILYHREDDLKNIVITFIRNFATHSCLI